MKSSQSNADLWHLFDEAMCARPCGSTCFTKVKGHSSMRDVQAGRVLQEDKVGNDGADELARAGAAEHALSEDLVANAKQQKETAKEVQRMMLRIIAARRQAEGRSERMDDVDEPLHECFVTPCLPGETSLLEAGWPGLPGETEPG